MNIQSLEVHFLASQVNPASLKGRAAVPIDVIRAGTTIVTGIANGAKAIKPYETIDEVKTLRTDDFAQGLLRGGERKGQLIDGFDLGNSPAEYSSEKVRDITIGFTTTNGTKAIAACREAETVFIGSFVNLSAISQALSQFAKATLVCAGTRDEMTTEDILFAGAVCDEIAKLAGRSVAELAGNRQVEIAAQMWNSVVRQTKAGQSLSQTLRNTQGGLDLIEIGMDSDIELVADIDKFDVVPELDRDNWVIA